MGSPGGQLPDFRFKSTKDTLSELLMKALHARDANEKVNACLSFLALGSAELALTKESKEVEREYLEKLAKWQKNWRFPKARIGIETLADKNVVAVIDDEKDTKSRWTVPPSEAAKYYGLAMDGMLLQSYQSELVPLVSEMAGKLTHYKVLRETAKEFEPQIDFLIGDKEGEDGEQYAE